MDLLPLPSGATKESTLMKQTALLELTTLVQQPTAPQVSQVQRQRQPVTNHFISMASDGDGCLQRRRSSDGR